MNFNIFGIGEVLWDTFPTGKRLGGAPANFVYHSHALGASAQVVTQVGNDDSGREIIQKLRELGLAADFVSIDRTHPTGTATIYLRENGQPFFTIQEDVAWDYLSSTPNLISAFTDADAVYFGILGQRREPSGGSIRSLLSRAAPQGLRVLDVNLRQTYYSKSLLVDSLKLANLVKLSDTELPVLSRLLELSGSPKHQLETLLQRYELRLVAFTRGENGSLLFDGNTWSEHPGLRIKVKDTVGAGDSFTAAVTLGTLSGWPLEKISAIANSVAAYVCSCDGAMPSLPAALRDYFKDC